MGCGASSQNPWSGQKLKRGSSLRKSCSNLKLKEGLDQDLPIIREEVPDEYSSEEMKFGRNQSKDSTEAPQSRRSSISELNQPIMSIHSAVHEGQSIAELEEILGDEYLFLEEQDSQDGNRPIHVAAQDGHLEIVQWLISKKCLVNARNRMGATALHMAVTYDHHRIVEVLLASDADRTITNAAGYEAITGLHGDKVEVLHASNADRAITNTAGYEAITGLHGNKIGTNAWDGELNTLQPARDAANPEDALTTKFKVLRKRSVERADRRTF